MSTAARVRALVGVVAVVTLALAAYVVVQLQHRDESAPVASTAAVSLTGPRIVFRNTTVDGTNGRVAAVPLDDPSGPRTYLGPTCDRVDVRGDVMVCLETESGLTTSFDQTLLVDGEVTHTWPLPGIPSRTRLSPSGRMVADTVFVNGHSYMQSGFSTATVIRRASGETIGNLERFTLRVDGSVLDKRDRNLWGVTFVDDDNFYATAASGGRTWLVRGSVPARTLTSVRENAECPSVSPDHTRVAYKKRTSGSHWAVAVLDLRTGTETVLPEKRSVDDQVTWLDDDTLLYGLPRRDTPGVSDIWRTAADGSGSPRLLIENAWSPAVVA